MKLVESPDGCEGPTALTCGGRMLMTATPKHKVIFFFFFFFRDFIFKKSLLNPIWTQSNKYFKFQHINLHKKV